MIEDESLGRYRIIQAEERYVDADRWLTDWGPATSWDEVRTFLRSYYPPGPELAAILKRTTTFRATGQQPASVEGLVDELSYGLAAFRGALDPLSLIGSIVPPRYTERAIFWEDVHERAWLRPFDGDGGFLTITGVPRMGKTNVACLYMDMWLRRDPEAVVLTNVALRDAHDRVDIHSRLSELARGVRAAVTAGRKWLWVFDDAGLAWLKQQAMKGSALDLEKFARVIPKHGGSLLYIDQREGGVPTTLSEFTLSSIRCIRPGFALLRMPRLPDAVREIPPSPIPYISGARSVLTLDIPFERLVP
ncbi:MAG: hypothetical protein A3K59_00155 [Euryarchaeota archaeon RBG_19FT_COMBO_69_17]|nr:MAG: hypothetical protein A3K59_00155 [Euryarchaeota archaeon RBG_19FT_COMBO_69_17]